MLIKPLFSKDEKYLLDKSSFSHSQFQNKTAQKPNPVKIGRIDHESTPPPEEGNVLRASTFQVTRIVTRAISCHIYLYFT